MKKSPTILPKIVRRDNTLNNYWSNKATSYATVE